MATTPHCPQCRAALDPTTLAQPYRRYACATIRHRDGDLWESLTCLRRQRDQRDAEIARLRSVLVEHDMERHLKSPARGR